MNYSRRANRPDGSHYRQMRRRNLKGADEGVAFRRGPRVGVAGFVVVLLALAALVGWMLWR